MQIRKKQDVDCQTDKSDVEEQVISLGLGLG